MSNLLLQLVAVCVVGQVDQQLDRHGDPLPVGAVGRLGSMRFRPGGEVMALALTPDGKTLASVSQGEIALWELATGKKTARFTGDEDPFLVAFADNGKTIATVSNPGLLRFRDVASGKVVHEVSLAKDPNDWENQAGISPDGRFLVCRNANNTAWIWDLAARKEHRRTDVKYEGGLVAVAGDGKLVALGRGAIEVWDAETGKMVHALRAKEASYLARLAFAADGKSLVSSGTFRHGTRSWDLKTGTVRTNYGKKPSETGAFAISPDSRLLATLHDDFHLRVWDLAGDKELWRIRTATHMINAMVFDAAGKTLVSTGREGIIRVWDVAAGKEIIRAPGPEPAPGRLLASPNGRWLIAATEVHSLWDMRKQELVARLEGAASYRPIVFSSDSKRFAYAHDDGSVRVCESNGVKEVLRFDASDKAGKIGNDATAIAFAADARTVLTAHADAMLRVRSADDGSLVREHTLLDRPRAAPGFLRGHSFSRDGSVLLASFDNNAEPFRAWDTRDARRLGGVPRLPGFVGSGKALAPDGRTFVNNHTDALTIHETVSGLRRLTLREVKNDPSNLAPQPFSPDGRLLATWDPRDKSIAIWDLATGKRAHRIEAVQGGTIEVTFVGNDLLATGGDDTTILLWDLREVRRKLTLPAGPKSPEEMGPLWEKLASDDPHEVMWHLVAGGDTTIAHLRKQLRPFEGATAAQIAEQIRRLDDASFVVRDKALRQLEQWGELSVSALLETLTKTPTLETRRRVEKLLEKLAPPIPAAPSAFRLREMRALEVAEHIDSPAAIDFVAGLTRGAAGAWLTREAQATLERMRSRP